MYIIHLLLSMYICTLCNLLHVTATKAVPPAQLLPDELFTLNHYEVLSFREEGDEDVVHIRKRAGQEDCGTDCFDYSGWTEDERMNCDVENVDAEDTAGEIVPGEDVPQRRTLLERGRKPSTYPCNGFDFFGDDSEGIKLISPTWPGVAHLEKTYGVVYDTGDPTQPLKNEWFELQQRDKRWTKDLVGRQPTTKNPNRCYAAEHVLEWQMLKAFIDEDSEKGDESRCMLLLKYFEKPMPRASYKVKVAKNQGKLGTDNHFEYEDKDYAFDKWGGKNKDEPRMIDWISSQWPGTAGGRPPNPWEYELVLLNQDANVMKANVWAGHRLFRKPIVGENTNKMNENEHNSGTLEWLFENKYYKDSMKTWPDNKGKCKAIYQFMTLMNIAQYHNQPHIQEIMRAQVRRVGEAWEHVEKVLLAGAQYKLPDGTLEHYKERGLKKEWLDWMKEKHKSRLDALTKAMDDKLEVFKKNPSVITKLKRWDYGGVFRRAVEEPNCGYEKDQKRIEQRIELLIDSYKKMRQVESDLELD